MSPFLNALIFIGFIALSAQAIAAEGTSEPGTESPEWFFCNTDSDCVVISDGCAGTTAVNTAYKDKAEHYYALLNVANSCAGLKDNEIPRAACIHGKTPCKKKTFFGLMEEDDPASTCINSQATCITAPPLPQAATTVTSPSAKDAR